MAEIDPTIPELEKRLDDLVRTQIDFQKEISLIRGELIRLKGTGEKPSENRQDRSFYVAPEPRQETPQKEWTKFTPKPDSAPPPRADTSRSVPPPTFGMGYSSSASSDSPELDRFTNFIDGYVENAHADLEKFIGENLLSKIGIIVLVLGVGIGAKYAIDNNLISPLTRIVIGYIFGFGLIGLAIKLKPKYLNFSAVLISGGMAIMYFVTFFAYSAYGLIPQLSAFALMVMFTAFTVAAALLYSRQVIAHIGLVGAYAVPFLLSSDSGNYLALFGYMTIVNSGILAISVKKYWTPIFYTSFVFTWLIFYGWFITKFSSAEHFYLAMTFAAVFFAIFYATKIAQKIYCDEIDEKENLIAALINGFVFYLFCASLGNSVVGNERLWVYFTFVAAASAVILISSFRFYKQAFVYLCFPFAWLIYGAWFTSRYDPAEHLTVAAVFAGVFFAIFYAAVLLHRLIANSFSFVEHTTAILSNSFVFYGFGYSILDQSPSLQGYLGLYTAANSGLHLAVAHMVSRLRSSAVDVVQVLTILILTFASIAVPVQFDGNFVTLIWAVEAALLFWYGRTQAIGLFEKFSYPVMVLAVLSMFADWFAAFAERTAYASEFNRTTLANGDLVTAIVVVIAFAFIYFVNRDPDYEPVLEETRRPIGWVVASVAVFVFYNALRIEIGNFHHAQLVAARAAAPDSYGLFTSIGYLNFIWQLNYTMLFLSAMGAVNIVKLRSKSLALINGVLSLLTLAAFSTVAMLLFNELRQSYISDAGGSAGWMNIGVRYATYSCAAMLIAVLYRYSRDEQLSGYIDDRTRQIGFEALLYGVLFIALSCELVNVMGQLRLPDAGKLGLSILWGVYALALIAVGIAKDRKHLRIAAFVLLGVTLAKLFLYDIADLDTIPKTILFVTLGITLLVISFLYNKYKNVLFGSTMGDGEIELNAEP